MNSKKPKEARCRQKSTEREQDKKRRATTNAGHRTAREESAGAEK